MGLECVLLWSVERNAAVTFRRYVRDAPDMDECLRMTIDSWPQKNRAAVADAADPAATHQPFHAASLGSVFVSPPSLPPLLPSPFNQRWRM